MNKPVIRVLVVDDSAVSRQSISQILETDNSIKVIDEAVDGTSAILLARTKKPDVIVMDIVMPGMNGFEATRQIMETNPLPILIVSGLQDPKEVSVLFKAMQAGALACMRKPGSPGNPEYKKQVKELIQNVKDLAGIRVVRRIPRQAQKPAECSIKEQGKTRFSGIDVIAIGVSTGGPAVLQEILSRLPRDFPVPILIVQHITTGFYEGFVEWLSEASDFNARLATDGERLNRGTAYIAPDGFQMGIDPNFRIRLVNAPPENGLRPSVSYLFRSLTSIHGEKVAAILLTGMGADGANELKGPPDKRSSDNYPGREEFGGIWDARRSVTPGCGRLCPYP
jgi:two-component system, chemotaxis family, protein-glutamate methylesterase/glutaminase